MVSKKKFFEVGQPAHVVSRALVDIFKNPEDCFKFIFLFQAANLGRRGFNVKGKDVVKAGRALLRGEKIPPSFIIKEHYPLVSLLDFAEVINHYHLYLVPNTERAISILMGRLNNALAKSFNAVYGRKDAVLGSRYKGIVVKTDFQSAAVTRYVSIVNPLDVFQPGWREKGINNWKKAKNFLENFEFSSFPDRIGIRKSIILAPDEVLERFPFGGSIKYRKEYRKFAEEFLKERSHLPYDLFLE